MTTRTRTRFIDELMAEVILYGGLPVRRCDVYDHALKVARTYDVTKEQAYRAAELYAFGPRARAVDMAPLTAAELEAITA